MKAVRRIGMVVLVIAVVALLWPARWGGFLGVTIVAGDSMEPGMSSGDIAVTWRQSAYEVGDVVPFEIPGLEKRYIIHRVHEIADDGTITTKGDNRDTADNYRLSAGDALGKRVLTIPRCTAWVCRSLGWPLLVMIVLLGTAAGVWVYAALTGRIGRPVFPEDPGALVTPGGVGFPDIERAASGHGYRHVVNLEPDLDLYTAHVVGIRIVAADDPTNAARSNRMLLDAANDILETLTGLGELDTTATAVLLDQPGVDWQHLFEKLAGTRRSQGDQIGRLELQVSAAMLGPDALDPEALAQLGISLVLGAPRTGLLANGSALLDRCRSQSASKIALDPLQTDALPDEPARSGLSHGVATSCMAGLEVAALGIEHEEQLVVLEAHGIEHWTGPVLTRHQRVHSQDSMPEPEPAGTQIPLGSGGETRNSVDSVNMSARLDPIARSPLWEPADDATPTPDPEC